MKIFNFSLIVKCASVVVAVFLFGVCAPCLIPSVKEVKTDGNITVVIDAGHGGIDGGVVGVGGTIESRLNLLVANQLKQSLSLYGFNVVLTRTTDAGLYGTTTKGFKLRDMKKRKEIIIKSNADVVISVHMNSFKSDKTRRGAQVFYRTDSQQCKNLALKIQDGLNEVILQRKYQPLVGDYYILNCSPAVSVLIECGFLSNEEDERLLNTSEYRSKLCDAIAVGVVEYLTESCVYPIK